MRVLGVDYDKMYSLMVLYQALQVIIALCALLQLKLHQIDVITVFLNGLIDKELYIEQLDSYEELGKPREDFIC